MNIAKFVRKQKILLFFLFCISSTFLFLPPSLNIGDQALVNLHINEHLIEYNKSNADNDFKKFYTAKYNQYFKNQLTNVQSNVVYGISKNNHYITDVEEVKALNRLAEYVLSAIFFHKIEMEKIFLLMNIIIFIITFITFYHCGRIIIDKNYALILSVLVSTNIYFNQLIRSTSEEQTLIFPFIFSLSIYFLIKLFFFIKRKIISSIGLGICIGMCITNGYPNTLNLLLPLILLSLAILFIINYIKFIKIENYNSISLKHYIFILFSSISTTLLISIPWSLLHGYSYFHHLNILNTRSDQIYSGNFTNNSSLSYLNYDMILSYLKNLSSVIFTKSKIYMGPHEPQFLFQLSYINLLEGLFFIIGIIIFFRNINLKKYANYFLFGTFFLFLFRSLTDNLWFVNKTNYDFYFLIHFFSAYGLYKISFKNLVVTNFLNYIINICKLAYLKIYLNFFKYNKFHFNIKKTNLLNKNILNRSLDYKSLILFIIISINSYNFNYNFVFQFNENLGLHNGIYEIKKYIKKNITHDKQLLLIDWKWSDIFYPTILTDLNGVYKFDNLNRIEIFTKENDLNYYKKFDDIFIVTPASYSTISLRNQFHGGRDRYNKILSNYFSLNNHEKIIKDRKNKPLYYLYKISKNDFHNLQSIDKKTNTYSIEINLKTNQKLTYFDFSGKVSNILIICNEKSLNYNLSNEYDFGHINFQKKSFFEIYNDFSNKKYIPIKKTNNILFIKSKSLKTSWEASAIYLSVKESEGYVEYEYEIPFESEIVQVSIPYIIYNNKNKTNQINLVLKNKKNNKTYSLKKIISNGNERFGNWLWKPPYDIMELDSYSAKHHVDYISEIHNFRKNTSKFSIIYKFKNNKYSDYKWATRLISNVRDQPEKVNHSILITSEISDNDKKFINNCSDKINVKIDLLNKESYGEQFFSYGLKNN